MLQAIIGALAGIGLFYILADLCAVPYYKTSQAVACLAGQQKKKTVVWDGWLSGIARHLARHLKLNVFRREALKADLKTAQMDISPEEYMAGAVVKSLLVGVLVLPAFAILPVLSPVVALLACAVFHHEKQAVNRRIKGNRDKIERELPGLVFTIEKSLNHTRDVVYMLESYADLADPVLRQELAITLADMASGNEESAILRLEARVGSSMMSDVCRGLISILRGDDTQMYWAALGIKFADIQRQQLRLQASRVPRRVKRLSMCLLCCFILIYTVVILEQILESLGVLFG